MAVVKTPRGERSRGRTVALAFLTAAAVVVAVSLLAYFLLAKPASQELSKSTPSKTTGATAAGSTLPSERKASGSASEGKTSGESSGAPFTMSGLPERCGPMMCPEEAGGASFKPLELSEADRAGALEVFERLRMAAAFYAASSSSFITDKTLASLAESGAQHARYLGTLLTAAGVEPPTGAFSPELAAELDTLLREGGSAERVRALAVGLEHTLESRLQAASPESEQLAEVFQHLQRGCRNSALLARG